ncbi:hypothetical protein NST02_17790 [Robertmurraya sp. FSL W8-0741]|uniref:hypothetical protein n=1 Tax=Robertmurraya sp. FSL W8-0741 TaxID=2954629 RepID=UPI0030FAA976
MASKKIKGITVEIGGDTVGLEKALKDVNQRTIEVQSELKDVQRLLKFDPNNVELLAQKQELLSQAIQSSTEKLNQLRAAQSQVEEQFRNGEIGEEQYRAFRRELQAAEQQLSGFEQALANMNEEQQRVQRGTRDLQTLFDATGTSVEDYANVIGQRLVRSIQNGTATSRDLEYAFQRIGRESIGAGGDIERLRNALRTVDSGSSIQDVRRDLQQLQSEAEGAADSVEGIGIELENVAGALAAGGGIKESIEQALDMSSVNTKIDISMEVPESSKQSIKEAVRTMVAYGLDAEEALEAVRRQWALNKDASDEANASIIKQAGAISKAYQGIDLIELIQETNEIASALKITNDEAIGLTNTLLKAGFPPEQLDTIAEYGMQMKGIGFTAAEIQAIFEAGIDTKTWNIDNLNDGVKEARITMSEFGLEIDKAMGELLGKAGMSQKQFKKWGKAVSEGGAEGSKAMAEVATWLDGIEDKALRNEIAIKVFGTKWEDQGDNLISVFQGVGEAADKTKENLTGIQDVTDRLDADPAIKLGQAMQDIKTASEPALLIIADIISKIAGWISENPKLAATLASVTAGLGILLGAVMALAPLLIFLKGASITLGISLSLLIGIIASVATGVALLIAAGVTLYQNWDTIEKKSSSVFSSVKTTIVNALETIKSSIANVSAAIADFAGPLLGKLVDALKDISSKIVNVFNGDFSQLGEIFKMLFPTLIAILVGGIPGLIISASRFLPAIVEGLESNKDVLIESINGVVANIIQFLEVGLPQLVGAGLNIVLNLITGIISALPMVVEVGVSLLQSLIAGIGIVLPIIITLALEVVTSLITTIAESLPRLVEAGTGILNSLIEGIVSVLPLLLAAALLLITTIVVTLVENLPKIIAMGVEILTALIEGIVKILPSLITTAVNLVVTIVKTLAENLPKIISAGVQVLEALIKGIIQILPTLIVTAINLVIQIAGTIIKNLPTILSAGKDILFSLIEGIISIVATLLSALTKEVIGPLLDKFEGVSLLDIGKNIIKGLIKGITSMASGVWDAVTSIGNSIKDAFTGMFDIHSPSRLFEGYGIYLNEGLIKGILSSAAKLKAAAQNVYGSLANSAKKIIDGNQKDGSNSKTIDNSRIMNNTINISTSSSDAQAVDRALRRLAYEF